MIDERIVSPQRTEADEQEASAPVSLRPTSLDDFVGQRQVCENLKVFIEAAKKRGEALDHVLLFGPPGPVSYTHLFSSMEIPAKRISCSKISHSLAERREPKSRRPSSTKVCLFSERFQ